MKATDLIRYTFESDIGRRQSIFTMEDIENGEVQCHGYNVVKIVGRDKGLGITDIKGKDVFEEDYFFDGDDKKCVIDNVVWRGGNQYVRVFKTNGIYTDHAITNSYFTIAGNIHMDKEQELKQELKNKICFEFKPNFDLDINIEVGGSVGGDASSGTWWFKLKGYRVQYGWELIIIKKNKM